MCVHVSVVIADQTLASQIADGLTEVDVVTYDNPLTGDFWEQASVPYDLLLVSASRLPEPLEESVRLLCNRMSGGKLVVVADNASPELQAILLTAGAECVLNPKISNELLCRVLKRIVQRCRDREPHSTNTNAHSWLPQDWRDLPWVQLRNRLISACEREYIDHHLSKANGRIGVVAQRTGLSHRAVNLMMKRHGVRKEPYRNTRNS